MNRKYNIKKNLNYASTSIPTFLDLFYQRVFLKEFNLSSFYDYKQKSLAFLPNGPPQFVLDV